MDRFHEHQIPAAHFGRKPNIPISTGYHEVPLNQKLHYLCLSLECSINVVRFLLKKKIPMGSISTEDWDFGYQGIANTFLAGSSDGHLNWPVESFLQI